jgi:dihydrofolate synthase / folylpolyglutamate synthase
MSYAAAIDQLNAMTPELLAGAGQPRRKFSLDQVRTLLHRLGDPQLEFQSVLIAGTNGKGSTASTLASILTVAGLRTGLYTSPHLERPNERIQINRDQIVDDAFAALYFKVHDAGQELVTSGELPQHPSYFEVLTALAFLYFAEKKVDVAVLEVGMGGRLDATNVVEPLLSIVTDISLDHIEWLGPTISAIAREKAGILRARGTMITLPQHPEANEVLGEVAIELGSRAVSAVPYMPSAYEGLTGPYSLEVLGETIEVNSPLAGGHQHRNVALAIAAAAELAIHYGFAITAAAIAEGVRSTQWPGRLERLSRGPIDWIFDVAHNPAGVWALRAGLRSLLGDEPPQTLVFSCLRDKPIAEMAQILFPLFEHVIVAPIHAARTASLDELLAAAQLTGVTAEAADSVRDALRRAEKRTPHGTIIVSGSVYLVGEARSILLPGEGAATKAGSDR